MKGKRKKQQRKQFSMGIALSKIQTERMKGRDKTMLQKKNEYWQEVKSE